MVRGTDADSEQSSKICGSLRDLTYQFQAQQDGGSSQAMLARIEDIQRDIHASNRHLEQLVSRRSNDSHCNSAHTTKRVRVGFQFIMFSFSVEFSSEQEGPDSKGTVTAKKFTRNVCTIRVPNWFVQNKHNLAIARSKNGWLFYPSVYRSVDRHSPFF